MYQDPCYARESYYTPNNLNGFYFIQTSLIVGCNKNNFKDIGKADIKDLHFIDPPFH